MLISIGRLASTGQCTLRCMDSIKDLLAGAKRNEPPEIAAIKDYIQQHFNSRAGVLLQERQVVISVPSAALAGTLRMHLPQLQELTGTDKRLVIRIGK